MLRLTQLCLLVFTGMYLQLTTACSDETPYKETLILNAQAEQTNEIVSGKIIDKTGLAGCRFLIELEDGRRLEPVNLDPALMSEGTFLSFSYTKADGYFSICMAGELVKLSDVKQIDGFLPEEQTPVQAKIR